MRAYSFQNLVVLINGVELNSFADGDDVVQVTRRQDSASDEVGADGKMMVAISADKSGEFTFKLQQTSPSNKFLMGLLALQEGGASSFVPVSVLVQDTYRNDLATGTTGYLKKSADMTRGKGGNTQEWTVVTERLDQIFGDTAENGILGGVI
jgi:hypothetical protein